MILASTSCMNPRIQANIAQNLNDIANELNAQRQDMALLQEQVDSLKLAMAHQDSVIKRLINITGLPPGNLGPGGGEREPGAKAVPPLMEAYLGGRSASEHGLRGEKP